MFKAIDWRFLGWFAGCYLAMYLAYALIPDPILQNEVYRYGIAWPAKYLIDLCSPGGHVVVAHNYLQSARANLQIVRGCDGASVLFLLIAAMIACRAPGSTTVPGVVGATISIYVVNELRIAALFLVESYHPSWFVPIHVYVIPTLMLLIGALYFAAWVARCPPPLCADV